MKNQHKTVSIAYQALIGLMSVSLAACGEDHSNFSEEDSLEKRASLTATWDIDEVSTGLAGRKLPVACTRDRNGSYSPRGFYPICISKTKTTQNYGAKRYPLLGFKVPNENNPDGFDCVVDFHFVPGNNCRHNYDTCGDILPKSKDYVSPTTTVGNDVWNLIPVKNSDDFGLMLLHAKSTRDDDKNAARCLAIKRKRKNGTGNRTHEVVIRTCDSNETTRWRFSGSYGDNLQADGGAYLKYKRDSRPSADGFYAKNLSLEGSDKGAFLLLSDAICEN